MTALQELQDYIKGNLNTLNKSISVDNRNYAFQAITLISEDVLNVIEELLEKEKQQIINSFDMGNEINTYSNGEQYYRETYE